MDFYKGGSIFLDEKLNNITHSLGSLYHPDLLLSVINASTEAITIENIRAIAEVRISSLFVCQPNEFRNV